MDKKLKTQGAPQTSKRPKKLYGKTRAKFGVLEEVLPASSKPKRNAKCLCGSGKKFKHCCGSEEPPTPEY